jgi:hypothetical protein
MNQIMEHWFCTKEQKYIKDVISMEYLQQKSENLIPQSQHNHMVGKLTSMDNGIQICMHLLSSVSMLLTNTTHNIN